MIVKVHRKVKIHKVPRTVAERRRKQELHRIVDELDAKLYDDAKRILLAISLQEIIF